jgi:hypothetical protein
VTKGTKIEIYYEGSTLEQVSCAKLLGIYIDSNLMWNEQYNYVCKKTSQKIGVLKKLRPIVDDYIMKTVYNSIVLPHMEYACIIWGRCSNQNNVNRVCKLQKRAARIILRCRVREVSSIELYRRMRWMPFNERVTFKRCILMYKVMNDMVPAYLQCFRPVSHRHNTRSSARGQLYCNKASLKYYTRSFRYEGARLWNDLDYDVQHTNSVHQFKSKYVKNYFN